MKMKEVLEKTGLTDRAVRLYIENSLVAPSIEESYSGRKNIEFSAEDVQRLKNIALLRKIGFSIPDIKAISQGGETAKETIEKFISQKQNSIEHDTLVVSQLQNISFENVLSIESLCRQLESVAENKQVPQEDLQLSKAEKIRREDYLTIATIGLISPVVIVGGSILLWLLGNKHLVFEDGEFELILCFNVGWIFIIAFSLIMLFINKPKFVSERKQKIRKHLSRILLLLDTGVAFLALGGSLFALVCTVMNNYEYSTDPNDYLVLDSTYERYEDEIMKVFPQKIPESRVKYNKVFGKVYDSTTEYYFHQQADIAVRFDIFAQWDLHNDEFAEEVMLKKGNSVETVQKGEWTVCFYVGDEESLYEREYFVVAFAYNEATYTVRYIATFGGGYDGFYSGSYYHLLEW